MPKPMKTYNPDERFCAQCGKLVIIRDPTAWAYRCRDYRKGGSAAQVIFCSWKCLQQFRARHLHHTERMILK